MKQSATNSFFQFVVGFLVFLSVFFGVTIAVNRVAANEAAQQQAAAAKAVMLTQVQ